MKPILIILSIAVVCYVFYRTYRSQHHDPQLPQLLSQRPLILDVRTPAEFEGGHIKGAVNIPLSRLRQPYIKLQRSQLIITCCSHGLRSVKAQQLLQGRGFTQVHNGGAWTELAEQLAAARQ